MASSASKTVSRRDLLIYAGAALATAALPVSYVVSSKKGLDPTGILLAQLNDPQSIAIVGKAGVGKAGTGNTKAIAERIAKRLAPYGWKPRQEHEGLKEALAKLMREEFRRGDMVDVMGWQISRTGAELCALAAASQAHSEA